MTEAEILEKIREKIGNQETSGVTDRTIQDFYGSWKDFETEENKDLVFNKILKQCETVKGQHNNSMRQLVQKEQELLSFKTEKDKLIADLEELKKTANTKPAGQEKTDVNEEMKTIMDKLTSLTSTIETLQKEKSETVLKETIQQRRKSVIEMVNDPKNGMPIEAITETLIEFWDFSKDMTPEEYLKAIQDKYNEKAKKYPQMTPFGNIGGFGGSDKSFVERKRAERAAEEERKKAKLDKIKERYKN